MVSLVARNREGQRSSRSVLVIAIVVAVVLAVGADVEAKKKKKRTKGYTGTGAGIGALLGLALGNGNILEDAASGAALGAAGGAIASAATRDKRERDYAEQEQAEAEAQGGTSDKNEQLADQERRLAEQQKQLETLQEDLTRVADARDTMQDDIISVVGPDVWEGYKALRACRHERAEALAGVAETSSEPVHQLSALWLRAMSAVDGKDAGGAQALFEKLAAEDPEIDTVQQASLATDQAVLDMRAERREIGIVCE